MNRGCKSVLALALAQRGAIGCQAAAQAIAHKRQVRVSAVPAPPEAVNSVPENLAVRRPTRCASHKAQKSRGSIISAYGAAALTILASLLLTNMTALSQVIINDTPALDLDQQLDIPLNNGTQGEDREQADFLLRLGGQAQQAGNDEKAIANWLQALELYQQVGDFQGLGLTYNYLGLTYAKLGRYRLAEDALRRRLGVARSQEDFQGQIFALNNLGTVLLQQGNLDDAQETFTQALTIARSVKNQEGEGLTLSNLGLAAFGKGNYFEAIKRYEVALTLRSQVGNPLGEANTRNNLGDAYRAVNGHNDALTSYRAALRLAKDSRDISNQFRALRGLVQSYSAVGQYPLAFQALNQHMALAQNEKNLSEQLFSLRLSGKLYRATGQLLNARYSYERAIALAGALGDTQEEALLRNDLAQIIYERGYR